MCTIIPNENEANVNWALKSFPSFELVSTELRLGERGWKATDYLIDSATQCKDMDHLQKDMTFVLAAKLESSQNKDSSGSSNQVESNTGQNQSRIIKSTLSTNFKSIVDRSQSYLKFLFNHALNVMDIVVEQLESINNSVESQENVTNANLLKKYTNLKVILKQTLHILQSDDEEKSNNSGGNNCTELKSQDNVTNVNIFKNYGRLKVLVDQALDILENSVNNSNKFKSQENITNVNILEQSDHETIPKESSDLQSRNKEEEIGPNDYNETIESVEVEIRSGVNDDLNNASPDEQDNKNETIKSSEKQFNVNIISNVSVVRFSQNLQKKQAESINNDTINDANNCYSDAVKTNKPNCPIKKNNCSTIVSKIVHHPTLSVSDLDMDIEYDTCLEEGDCIFNKMKQLKCTDPRSLNLTENKTRKRKRKEIKQAYEAKRKKHPIQYDTDFLDNFDYPYWPGQQSNCNAVSSEKNTIQSQDTTFRCLKCKTLYLFQRKTTIKKYTIECLDCKIKYKCTQDIFGKWTAKEQHNE